MNLEEHIFGQLRGISMVELRNLPLFSQVKSCLLEEQAESVFPLISHQVGIVAVLHLILF